MKFAPACISSKPILGCTTAYLCRSRQRTGAPIPGLQVPPHWLSLASWIGGDRDGNPTSPPRLLRNPAIASRFGNRNLPPPMQDLSRHLSVSSQRIAPPPELLKWIEKRHPFPARIAYIEERYATEPYRLVLSLLTNDLAEASRDDMKSHLLSRKPHRAKIYSGDIEHMLEISPNHFHPRWLGTN